MGVLCCRNSACRPIRLRITLATKVRFRPNFRLRPGMCCGVIGPVPFLLFAPCVLQFRVTRVWAFHSLCGVSHDGNVSSVRALGRPLSVIIDELIVLIIAGCEPDALGGLRENACVDVR